MIPAEKRKKGMKSIMKKIASLVLALTLGLTAVPLTVSAAEDAKPISDKDMLTILSANEQIPLRNAKQTGMNVIWGGSGEDKLVDGDTVDTKLGGEATEVKDDNVTLTWEADSVVPAYFVIYTGGDTSRYAGRNPKSIKLYGVTQSNKDELLLQASNFMGALDSHAYGFALDTNTAYTNYKLVLTTEKQLQLNEIKLLSNKTRDIVAKEGLEAGRIDISGCTGIKTFQNSNGACGFIDGNLNFNLPIAEYIGATNTEELLSKTQVYLNGEKAKFNYSYNGYTHCGMNSSRGYFFGIVSAEYVKDTENTVLFLIGDEYYVKMTYKPNSTAVAVQESLAQYYVDRGSCKATVTFKSNPGYTVGETCKAQLHDDHEDRDFLVTEVDGNTVTFECKKFSTSKTLLEFNKGTDKAFTIPIDECINTTTALGYAQTRTNGDSSFDLRILVEANEDYLRDYKNAVIKATFIDESGREIVVSPDQAYVKAYKSVTAGGDRYVASNHCGLFGIIVYSVPYPTKSVSATVTFTGNDGKTTKEINLGSVNFQFTVPTQFDKLTGTAYSADKINVYTNDQFSDKLTGSGESEDKLFDGTAYKMGGKDSPIYFKTDDKVTITGLVFTIGNDSANYSDRTFLNWKVSAKADDGSWVVIASSDNPIKLGQGLGTFDNSTDLKIENVDSKFKDAFAVYNAGAYSEFKLEYERDRGYTQMAELTLYTK